MGGQGGLRLGETGHRFAKAYRGVARRTAATLDGHRIFCPISQRLLLSRFKLETVRKADQYYFQTVF